MPDRHALTPLSTALERRQCPICKRYYKVLPHSKIVYDSQFCAYQGIHLNVRYDAYGNIITASTFKPTGGRNRKRQKVHPWIKD